MSVIGLQRESVFNHHQTLALGWRQALKGGVLASKGKLFGL